MAHERLVSSLKAAEIRVWPIDLGHLPKEDIETELDRAEYTLFVKVIEESSFKAVLNEKPPRKTELIKLPVEHAGRVIPADIFPQRKHPDVRLARQASTIAALARVISERKVTKWLRTTLLTQARRLERLAAERLAEFAGTPDEGDDEIESKD